MELKLDILKGLWNVHGQIKPNREVPTHDMERLRSHAIMIGNNNHAIMNMIDTLKTYQTVAADSKEVQKMISQAKDMLKDENEWQLFNNYFEDTFHDFQNILSRHHPEISYHELRLMSLIRIKLSTTEITKALNISPEGVKKARYRLRKKLGLATTDSLEEFVLSI